MDDYMTSKLCSRTSGELIDMITGTLIGGSFVFTIGCHPDVGWTLRYTDKTGRERQANAGSFGAAWDALWPEANSLPDPREA